ncbi:hypothetical protein BpHYR1_022945 [Brachionus plicatilis]|uniref:Uncharacterized protein n=1 Tax=Brachionus plicatilis TaxID=10195 RepID=A0A3M7PP38_BRAPC|nr:hypothetical protein BpHYR1_022945 [Brachionus plicatilis]
MRACVVFANKNPTTCLGLAPLLRIFTQILKRYFELGILFQHNQFLNSTMKKTFNTIRFLLSSKKLEVSH